MFVIISYDYGSTYFHSSFSCKIKEEASKAAGSAWHKAAAKIYLLFYDRCKYYSDVLHSLKPITVIQIFLVSVVNNREIKH